MDPEVTTDDADYNEQGAQHTITGVFFYGDIFEEPEPSFGGG